MTRVPIGAAAVALALVGCAAKPMVLPSGSGAPFPEYRAAFGEATERCRSVRTWTAELGLAGRAGRVKLRGRALVGLERPAAVRLEGIAPFGQPAFILVARADNATLFLPRDRRVLHDQPAGAIVEALTGVPLGAEALRQVLTGCLASSEPAGGRAYAGGWFAVDLGPSATAYLRQVGGHWRIEAGTRSGLTIEYRDYVTAGPGRVRLTLPPAPSAAPDSGVDLILTIAQVDINVSLPDRTFELNVPPDALPMTLDQLRESGPLGVRQ